MKNNPLFTRLSAHLRQFAHEVMASVRRADPQNADNPRSLLFSDARLTHEDFGDLKLLVMRDEPIINVMRKQAEDGSEVLDTIVQILCDTASDIIHIDVGANYGMDLCHTAKAILKTHPNAHIAGFDPGKVKDITPHNITLNGLAGKVAFFPLAVADYSGFITLYSEQDHSENNRIVNPMKLHTRKTIVPCTTLDSYIEALNRPAATLFLKIDTQGAEPEVLAGAANTLKNYPCVMIAEFTPHSIATRHDPVRFLADLAETHDIIDLGHTRQAVKGVDADFEAFAAEVTSRAVQWTDILLLPKSAPALSAAILSDLQV